MCYNDIATKSTKARIIQLSMPYLKFPQPKDKYCRKHGITYQGYICPECAKDREKEAIERQNKQKRKEAFQSLLDGIFQKQKGNEEIETADYKLKICPECGERSLFVDKHNPMIRECFNKN